MMNDYNGVVKTETETTNRKDSIMFLNIANFLNNLADWLEDNVDYDADDEFDRKLNDIRYRAQDLYDRYQY